MAAFNPVTGDVGWHTKAGDLNASNESVGQCALNAAKEAIFCAATNSNSSTSTTVNLTRVSVADGSAKSMSVEGSSNFVIVGDDVVVLRADHDGGEIVRYDGNSGKQKWSTTFESDSNQSEKPWLTSEGSMVAAIGVTSGGQGTSIIVDPENGALIPGIAGMLIPVSGSWFAYSSDAGSGELDRLGADGKALWSVYDMSYFGIGDDGSVFMVRQDDKGRLVQAVDPKTGKAVWEKPLANGSGQITVSNGRVFVGDGSRVRILDAATGDTVGSAVGSFRGLGHHVLYTTNDTYLAAYAVADGSKLWQVNTDRIASARSGMDLYNTGDRLLLTGKDSIQALLPGNEK